MPNDDVNRDAQALWEKSLERQDLVGMQRALEQGVDPNTSVEYGSIKGPSLVRVAKELWMEGVGWLLKHGADVHAKDERGEEVLLAFLASVVSSVSAISKTSALIAQRLIEAGSNVNEISPIAGDSPLLRAMYVEDPVLANTLLDAGADANHGIPYDNNVLLEWAIRSNPLLITKANLGADRMALGQRLIDLGADRTRTSWLGETLVHIAAENQVSTVFWDMLERWFEPHPSFWVQVDAKGNTPLHIAALNGNLVAVERLLNHHEDGVSLEAINQDGVAPLDESNIVLMPEQTRDALLGLKARHEQKLLQQHVVGRHPAGLNSKIRKKRL